MEKEKVKLPENFKEWNAFMRDIYKLDKIFDDHSMADCIIHEDLRASKINKILCFDNDLSPFVKETLITYLRLWTSIEKKFEEVRPSKYDIIKSWARKNIELFVCLGYDEGWIKENIRNIKRGVRFSYLLPAKGYDYYEVSKKVDNIASDTPTCEFVRGILYLYFGNSRLGRSQLF